MINRKKQFTLIELICATTAALLVVAGIQQLLNLGFIGWQSGREASNFNGAYLRMHQLIYKGLNSGKYLGGGPPDNEPKAMISGWRFGELTGGPGRRLYYDVSGGQRYSLRWSDGQIILRRESNGREISLIGNPTPTGSPKDWASRNQIRVARPPSLRFYTWPMPATTVNWSQFSFPQNNNVNGTVTNNLTSGDRNTMFNKIKNNTCYTRVGRVEIFFTLYNDSDLSGTMSPNKEYDEFNGRKDFRFTFHFKNNTSYGY
ncbi:hypothetical protein ACFL35_11090 [Candidatus Riflebacteria bacterium]